MKFSTEKREELKEKGQAMPHGEFPIRNVADLKRAIQAFGRAKNPAATKAWIKKRAKELNAENLLPDSWKQPVTHSNVISFIEHYGTKGMRWGVRKPRNEAARAKRFGKKKAEGNQAQDKGERRHTDRTVFGKAPSRLTNAQLESRIKRMDMEKRYNDLNKREVSQGEKLAREIATNVGKQVITNIATTALTGLGQQALRSALSKSGKAKAGKLPLDAINKMTGFGKK